MMHPILEYVLDLFYPKKCIFCGKKIDFTLEIEVCEDCNCELTQIENGCAKCGRKRRYSAIINDKCTTCIERRNYFVRAFTYFSYEDKVKQAIYNFKFRDEVGYKSVFSYYLAYLIKDIVNEIDFMIYPPISKKRYMKRGYNQSELLCQELQKRTSIPVISTMLLKTRDNEPQSLQKGRDRYLNVKDAFKVNEKKKELIKGKTVLIVDDVFTTGATMNECAKVLRKSGAKRVYVATIASVND